MSKPDQPTTTAATDRAKLRRFWMARRLPAAEERIRAMSRTGGCNAAWHRAQIEEGQLAAHPSCLGRAAAISDGRVPVGCLCECHDKEPGA